ncbi:HAD family hydrolase [uncultured Peptoniphilus sp.]|uniref:HAD family hydrolase n=1 Tax=uncultured Peptoniphilus sp. TaxID=254354 RepID=UPI0025894D74|nr:HAD family hydrolase [uncultured Peptoniphilus sp.]MDU6783510.1 HAD family hydrolase [Peptoniphilus harei]
MAKLNRENLNCKNDELKNVKSIIFDFDGTLHNTIKIYYPAFSSGVEFLRNHGFAKDFELNEKNVSKFLGEKPNFAYDLIAKGADEKLKREVMALVGKKMDENIKNGLGKLYEGTIKVLEELSEDYDLYILSNCRESYLDTALDVYGIKKYFKKYFAAETYDFLPKEDIIKKERQKIKEEIIFVGDRHHDMEAARKNNIRSIFCTYGFGSEEEGKDASYKISSIGEILKLL